MQTSKIGYKLKTKYRFKKERAMRYSTQNPMLKSLFGKICWKERALNTVQPLVVNCGRGGCVPRLLLLPSKNTDFTQAAVEETFYLPRVGVTSFVTFPQILTPVSPGILQ